MAIGPDMPDNFSRGYTFDLGNGLQEITRQEVGSWGWAAGGLVSDLTDMKLCAEAFADGRLLSKELQDEFMNWIPLPVKPGTPQDSFTGLGIVKTRGIVGNSGGTYGYTSWMWHHPEKKITLVAFFNQTSAFTNELAEKEQNKLAELLETIQRVM
ncbi:MAG: serine hydrolase [Candidatus Ozemobacteraceae bacterium]